MDGYRDMRYLGERWGWPVVVLLGLWWLLMPGLVLAVEVDVQALPAIRAIGMNGDSIAFQTAWDRDGRKGFSHVFDLGKMRLDDQRLRRLRFRKMKSGWKEYNLTFPMNNKNHAVLDLRHLGMHEYTFDWSDLPGQRHNAFGFLKNGNWLSGGESGVLYVYNTMGERLAVLEGHHGTITALAYYNNWLVSGDSNGLMILWDMNEVKTGRKRLRPFLSLAYAGVDKWAIWSTEGVFTASEQGAGLLASGNTPLADSYQRPDLLQQKMHDPRLYYKIVAHELTLPGSDFAPPTVTFVEVPVVSDKRDIQVVMEVCDSGAGIARAQLYLRGAEINLDEASRGVSFANKGAVAKQCNRYGRSISLLAGNNELTLTARDGKGQEAQAQQAVIAYKPAQSRARQMHVLTVGVSAYNDPPAPLAYPVIDAKAIAQAFETLGYGLFARVNIYSLLDREVTADRLTRMFVSLRDKVSENDVFVLYLAGHGVYLPTQARYYYLPFDVDASSPERLAATAIAVEDFAEMLTNIKATQTLLLIDTCQSGAFQGFMAQDKAEGAAQVRVVNELGRASLMASSRTQVAYEGYKGHGVFTAMVLEAFTGKADYTGDGVISVDELATYVSTHLAELTQRKWGYRQEARRNLSGHNFNLGRY